MLLVRIAMKNAEGCIDVPGKTNAPCRLGPSFSELT
jgi:hypothetical protein